MSAGAEENIEIHDANIYLEDLEDDIDHGRSASYDLDHKERSRRESIFTISKNELKRVPSLVNLEAHKVFIKYLSK